MVVVLSEDSCPRPARGFVHDVSREHGEGGEAHKSGVQFHKSGFSPTKVGSQCHKNGVGAGVGPIKVGVQQKWRYEKTLESPPGAIQ